MEKTKVRVLKIKGKAALVEWTDEDGPHRGTIPATELSEEGVSSRTLSMAVKVGVPWSSLITIETTPQSIARALRERGIFTADDLLSNVRVAEKAIQDAIGVDVRALIRAVKNL
jgi:hypothetical protein